MHKPNKIECFSPPSKMSIKISEDVSIAFYTHLAGVRVAVVESSLGDFSHFFLHTLLLRSYGV